MSIPLFQNEIFLWEELRTGNEANLFTSTAHNEPCVLIALDEVGRGCLAGPVYTCASAWKVTRSKTKKDSLYPSWYSHIRDSKKLSPAQRERIFFSVCQDFPSISSYRFQEQQEAVSLHPIFSDPHVFVQPSLSPAKKKQKNHYTLTLLDIALGAASADEIDKHNIWKSVQIAMGRCLLQLQQTVESHAVMEQTVILVDGKTPIQVPLPYVSAQMVTAIGGDDKFVTIGVSSIIAKVTRDQLMVNLSAQFPEYAFESHKGYGTSEHIKRILSHTPCLQHRRSFLGKILSLPRK